MRVKLGSEIHFPLRHLTTLACNYGNAQYDLESDQILINLKISMHPKLTTVIAFFITLLVASFATCFPMLLEKNHNNIASDLPEVLFVSILFLPYPIAATLLFGVPVFLIFRKLKIVFWWSSLIVGTIGGFIMSFITTTYPETPIQEMIQCTISGMIASVSFWAVWRLGNSNK